MSTADEAPGGPALLCYDGSDAAGRAIERAGRVVGGGPATVLTVWESVGSAFLRHRPRTALGRELTAISADVVGELDSGTAQSAEATAQEGAELATQAGFQATPLARRAIARAAEREDATVWQAILHAADERDAKVVVLGTRGRSGVRSLLMGSVSSGVLHHAQRAVLLVPGGEARPPWGGPAPRSLGPSCDHGSPCSSA